MLSKTQEILDTAINDDRAFPGAQIGVFDNGTELSLSAGTINGYSRAAKVSQNTLFDLASITKVVATTSAVALLIQNGIMTLEDRIVDWIPDAAKTVHANVTIAQLLSHTAGFPAWAPLYETVSVIRIGKLSAGNEMEETALLTKPISEPGQKEIYSDLDFYLLGRIVALASNDLLDNYVQNSILDPLRMKNTCYRPLDKKIPKSHIAPTGAYSGQKQEIHGIVNDNNAWTAGQVAGQAGLFGTTTDLMAFASEIIHGFKGDGVLFKKDLLETFSTRLYPQLPGSFALGWDTVSEVGTLTGSHFGPNTIGHHGFTGTSFWIDPDQRIAIAILTNRVHFGDDKTKINKYRPLLFDAIWEDIGRV